MTSSPLIFFGSDLSKDLAGNMSPPGIFLLSEVLEHENTHDEASVLRVR